MPCKYASLRATDEGITSVISRGPISKSPRTPQHALRTASRCRYALGSLIPWRIRLLELSWHSPCTVRVVCKTYLFYEVVDAILLQPSSSSSSSEEWIVLCFFALAALYIVEYPALSLTASPTAIVMAWLGAPDGNLKNSLKNPSR
jgi:hypothetical protein